MDRRPAPAAPEEDPSPAADATSVDPGVEGNDRLTSTVGMVLTVLLLVEGATLLDVQGMITVHLYVGLLLLGPIALKIASTLYRFARYYLNHQPYVRRGPPHPLLRLMGPPLILATVAVMASGVALVFADPQRPGLALNLHHVSFVVWVGLLGIHLLAHLPHAAAHTWKELRPARGDPVARRRNARAAAVAAALIIGVGAATALMPSSAPWRSAPVTSGP